MAKQKDDIRDLLGKIRRLQEENTPITSLESADIRKLLEEQTKQRPVKISNYRLISEEVEEEIDVEVSSEEAQEVTPDEQREEENKFKDTVSKLAKFNKIKVFRQNVEWSGELVREKIR